MKFLITSGTISKTNLLFYVIFIGIVIVIISYIKKKIQFAHMLMVRTWDKEKNIFIIDETKIM